MQTLVDVTGVVVLGNYRLRLMFADGVVGDIDFSNEDFSGEMFEPLKDPAFFARVFVDHELGTIAWPNGLDFAPEPLYEKCAAQLQPGDEFAS